MAAALCAGLMVATARAGDGDGDLRALPPVKPSWWSGMTAAKEEPAVPKKIVPAENLPPQPAANTAATVQAREEAAYLRRMQVCDDLLEVADRTGDEAFREKVNQLMDKVWEVYLQRTGSVRARGADAATLTRTAPPSAAPSRQAAAEDTAPWKRRGE
jgi:hypothetical protein